MADVDNSYLYIAKKVVILQNQKKTKQVKNHTQQNRQSRQGLFIPNTAQKVQHNENIRRNHS